MFDIHVRQAEGCVQAPCYIQRTRERGRKRGTERDREVEQRSSHHSFGIWYLRTGSSTISLFVSPAFLSRGDHRFHVERKQGHFSLTELQGPGLSSHACRWLGS